MEYFDGETFYNLVKNGYKEVFSGYGIPRGTPYKCTIPNKEVENFYKEHGYFENGKYYLNQDERINVEIVDNGDLGVIFGDDVEFTFSSNDVPEFLVSFSGLGGLVMEFAQQFGLSFEKAAEQIFWLRNREVK